MVRSHREALLEAARVLLRRKGLRATTARDLVEESGTNLASIGYHFGSKDALMATAVTAICQEWTERPVAAASRDGAGPGEALAAAVREMLSDLPGQRPEILAFLETVVAAGRGEAAGEALAASSRASLEAVAASMAATVPDLPAEVLAAGAAVIIALHDGLALLSTVLPDDTPDPETVLWVLAGFGAALAPTVIAPPNEDPPRGRDLDPGA